MVSIFAPMLSNGASAKSLHDVHKLKLKDIYIHVPYDLTTVNIKRTETANTVRVELLDKKTGKQLTAYGEKVVKLTSPTAAKESEIKSSAISPNLTAYPNNTLDYFVVLLLFHFGHVPSIY
jgi:hypothetical protein